VTPTRIPGDEPGSRATKVAECAGVDTNVLPAAADVGWPVDSRALAVVDVRPALGTARYSSGQIPD